MCFLLFIISKSNNFQFATHLASWSLSSSTKTTFLPFATFVMTISFVQTLTSIRLLLELPSQIFVSNVHVPPTRFSSANISKLNRKNNDKYHSLSLSLCRAHFHSFSRLPYINITFYGYFYISSSFRTCSSAFRCHFRLLYPSDTTLFRYAKLTVDLISV